MKAETKFLTEFLTELNAVLTEENYADKYQDIVSPIRNFFIEKNDLTAFSLARYYGGNTRIAFFAEWYSQILDITQDSKDLFKVNQEYLRKKIPLSYRGIPNLYEIIDNHIREIFLPRQIALIHSKTTELILELESKYPYLKKYLSKEALAKNSLGEIINISKLYQIKVSLSQFIEGQGYRSHYIKIAFPCLISMIYSFNQVNSTANAKEIRWVLLEELLKNIAVLFEIKNSKDLQKFLYQVSLSDTEEFNWLKMNPTLQLKMAMADSGAREKSKSVRDKIYQKAKDNLYALNVPDKYKSMLKDLIDWSA
jgi:hypothetical protein